MEDKLNKLIELLTPRGRPERAAPEPVVVKVDAGPTAQKLRERVRELEAENQRLTLALKRFVDELQ